MTRRIRRSVIVASLIWHHAVMRVFALMLPLLSALAKAVADAPPISGNDRR
jgi:hypothetical protein